MTRIKSGFTDCTHCDQIADCRCDNCEAPICLDHRFKSLPRDCVGDYCCERCALFSNAEEAVACDPKPCDECGETIEEGDIFAILPGPKNLCQECYCKPTPTPSGDE